ncbi:MAG: alpha/beta hydrolase [Isosphaeraceae bacterium]|nr:alpha/beta hydrolase [Isosphaeraceae bacterium]
MGGRIGRLRSTWTIVNGQPIHARVSAEPVPAEAPAVVLVHGMSVSSRYLVPTAERLAPFYRVFAPDLPGFGLSVKPRRTLDVPELADALAAWMNAAGLGRAALLGNSFGCQIIANFAARYPERVERAVLQGPTVPADERTVPRQLLRWLQNSPLEPPSLSLVVARDYLDCGPRRLVETFRYALRDRIEAKLPCIHAPVLVVRGSRDVMCPQDWAEMVIRLVPDGRLRVIPGGSHTLVYAAPLELVRVVRPFLDEARGPRGEPQPLGGGRAHESAIHPQLHREL